MKEAIRQALREMTKIDALSGDERPMVRYLAPRLRALGGNGQPGGQPVRRLYGGVAPVFARWLARCRALEPLQTETGQHYR